MLEEHAVAFDVGANVIGVPLALPIASQHDATATDPARPPRMAAQLIQESNSGIKGSSSLKAELGAAHSPASVSVHSASSLMRLRCSSNKSSLSCTPQTVNCNNQKQ